MIGIVFCQTHDARLNNAIRDTLRNGLKSRGQLPCWEEITVKDATTKKLSLGQVQISKKSRFILKSVEDVAMFERLLIDVLPKENYKNGHRSNWRNHTLQVCVSILIAIFPKCPLCWIAFLSSIGCLSAASFLNDRFVLITLALIGAVNIYIMYSRSRRKGNLRYFFLSFIGFTLILLNFLIFRNETLRFAGAFVVTIGSIMSIRDVNLFTWPREKSYP